MGIEKRNYRHNSTESPLLHDTTDNFKWAVCLAWPLNKQTNKTNKWDTTAIPVATNSLDISLAIKFAIRNQCQNRSKPKYGHFASIVIEINRSKLIILHRNLDVNESQENSKTSQNRSFCITDHCAKLMVDRLPRTKNVEALKQRLNTDHFPFFNWILFFFLFSIINFDNSLSRQMFLPMLRNVKFAHLRACNERPSL